MLPKEGLLLFFNHFKNFNSPAKVKLLEKLSSGHFRTNFNQI